MIRQSSSRNQRSKGVRVKHVLQIFMLLAVCFWLIYQVKHSYYKRKQFEGNDGEISEGKLPKFDEIIKLGRKNIRPRVKEFSTNNEKIDEEEVDDEEILGKGDESLEETQEELERKRKEEGSADIEALLDGSSRGEEAAGGRVGNDDDDIDEQDLDKAEKEGDGDDDVVEVDKDIEKDEENEIDEKDGDEDNEHRQENDGSLDDQGHGSSGDRHDAREEQYRADDASSAVANVGQNILSENPERKNTNSDLDAQEFGSSFNETYVAEEQHSNAANVFETPPSVLVKNDTSEVSSGTVDSTPQNEEGHVLELTPEQNSTTGGLSTDKSSNTTNETEYSPIITINTTDSYVEQDVNSNSTVTQETSTSDFVAGSNMTSSAIANKREAFNMDGEHEDEIQDSKDTEEDSILSTLNDDETLRDPLISEEEEEAAYKERESRIDLDTLPELKIEGTDSDDAATE